MTGLILLIAGFITASAGLFNCLTNKRFMGFLFGIELILNGSALNFAGFYQIHNHIPEFQVGILLIVSYAVLETVVGLAIFTWASKALQGQPEISIL